MKYDRIWNFNAGPAALPLEVLERVHEPWFNFMNGGMALMEMSHRSKEFDGLHNETIARFKSLLGLGDNYHVLLLQGGASLQFAMLPMGFLPAGKTADYINTGTWSTKAINEAKRYGNVNIAFEGKDVDFKHIPTQDELKLTKDAEYVHVTSNNTIKGTEFFTFPEVGDVPLVADMSSDILSHQFDATKFAMIYGGAQKNLGPSGVTFVIMRDDFYQKANTDLPAMLSYKTHVDKNSLYNTPNTFGIYIIGEVLKWVEEQGGASGMEKINRAKADLLYGFMDDNADFYRGTVEKEARSIMNVCMRLPNEEIEAKFVAEGLKAGFIGLKGHRSVGGIRISMYNAVPLQAIEDVVAFMKKFMANNA